MSILLPPLVWVVRLLKHLAGVLDSMVLALAVAAPFEQGEVLDVEYAEAMVLVIDEYMCSRSDRLKWSPGADLTFE